MPHSLAIQEGGIFDQGKDFYSDWRNRFSEFGRRVSGLEGKANQNSVVMNPDGTMSLRGEAGAGEEKGFFSPMKVLGVVSALVGLTYLSVSCVELANNFREQLPHKGVDTIEVFVNSLNELGVPTRDISNLDFINTNFFLSSLGKEEGSVATYSAESLGKPQIRTNFFEFNPRSVLHELGHHHERVIPFHEIERLDQTIQQVLLEAESIERGGLENPTAKQIIFRQNYLGRFYSSYLCLSSQLEKGLIDEERFRSELRAEAYEEFYSPLQDPSPIAREAHTLYLRRFDEHFPVSEVSFSKSDISLHEASSLRDLPSLLGLNFKFLTGSFYHYYLNRFRNLF